MISSDTIRIRSAQGDYQVEEFEEISTLFGALASIDNAFFVADEHVANLYAPSFAHLGAAPVYTMPATEAEKTLAGVERALFALQKSGGSKRTTVVGIGGGIVQDVATLVAHLWYRGIEFVYVPTTLLGMADSCIGAKSAVNLGSFKNQIGTFQSPSRVLACGGFVSTLSDEAVASGYGEIVKLAMIDSAASFDRVRNDLDSDGMRGPNVRAHIRISLEAKRKVIEVDEYELNLRKILNFGHTFGHALESVLNNDVPHGLAVVWGVDVAIYVAARQGFIERETSQGMHEFLHRTFRFTIPRAIAASDLISAMRRDKKAAAGLVSLVLPRAIGQIELFETKIDSSLEALVSDYLRESNIYAM